MVTILVVVAVQYLVTKQQKIQKHIQIQHKEMTTHCSSSAVATAVASSASLSTFATTTNSSSYKRYSYNIILIYIITGIIFISGFVSIFLFFFFLFPKRIPCRSKYVAIELKTIFRVLKELVLQSVCCCLKVHLFHNCECCLFECMFVYLCEIFLRVCVNVTLF